MGYIYILTSPSGKSYIGQTTRPIQKRFKEHQDALSGCRVIRNAIQYHGWESFEKDWYECPDEDLNFDEDLLVREMGTLVPGGYNLREGGGSHGRHSEETKQKISEANIGKTHSEETKKKMSDLHLGKTHTEETKQQMSEAKTGSIHTDETKKKISEAKTGTIHTEEHKQKISEAQLGKTHSEETKQKISESLSGEKNYRSKRVYQYDLEGNELGTFPSTGEAARYLKKKSGSIISRCARGKLKSAHGFKWSYTIVKE